MNTLYIVRHGQTEWNVQSRMQGRLDSALTETGRQQASAHGAAIAALGGVDLLYVSPLGRTRETADILNSHLKAEMRFEDALMERDCGIWSGHTVDEVAELWPEAWKARNEDPFHHRPPEGENLVDMLARSEAFLDSLAAHEGQTIGLVTHGVMSRCVLTRYLDLAPARAPQVKHPNGIFYRLQFESGEVTPSHFFAEASQQSDGPHAVAGLLHEEVDGTIARP